MVLELGRLEPFRIHDLRRTCRTRLAELGVGDVIAEMCLGHRQGGVVKTYNRHPYQREQREALEVWQGMIDRIVEPAAKRVVGLRK